MDRDTLGDYFLRDDGTVWKQIAFTDQPTVCLERVKDDGSPLPADVVAPRVEAVVGSPITRTFARVKRIDRIKLTIPPEVLATLSPDDRRIAELLVSGAIVVRDVGSTWAML